MNYKIIILALALIVAPLSLGAQVQQDQDSTYYFHLYFDSGKLVTDRNFEFPYDVVPEASQGSSGQYKAEVINMMGKVAEKISFDPKSGNANFIKGSITVKVPYWADGKEVKFYNEKGVLLLSVDVWGSSFCDDDGVCEESYGENYKNCSNDCKSVAITGGPSPSSGPVTGSGGGWGSLVWIILGAGALIALSIYGFRWFMARRSRAIPPQQGV